MKSCPVCHGTYDDTQSFCLNDGSALVNAAPGPPPAGLPTENLPYNRGSAPTDVMYGGQTSGSPYAPPTAPPVAPYMMPPGRKRSPLPWIIGGALVVIAAVVIIILVTRGSKEANPPGGGSDPITGRPSSPGGVSYNSPDGRFSVTLPPGFSQFKSQTTKQPTPAGDIELTILQTETPRGGCMVGFSDFPEASFVGRTQQKMLEDGRDGALRNIGGTLEKQENMTIHGKTAIAIYGSGRAGAKTYYVRFNFILDKPRAYQVGYLAYERADLDKPEIQAYFDSFRLK